MTTKPSTFRNLRIALLVALGGIILGQDSDRGAIRADVMSPQAHPYDTGDADIVGFEISYDVRFTNPLEEPMDIPVVKEGDPRDSIVMNSVEVRRPDGTWSYVMHPGLPVRDATKQEDPCTSLGPGKSMDEKRLRGGFVMYKNDLPALGQHPTLRAGLDLWCQRPDGKGVLGQAETEPFVLFVPTP